MKIYKIIIAATLFLFITCVEGIYFAQTSSWSADVTHSNMGFKALHKGVAYTVGEFRDFETEQYPNITFKTNSITEIDENIYTLRGVFTMHGVSKEIEVQMKHIGTTQSRGKEIAGLYFTATVNRMDYGVGLDLSSVASEVQLQADIEIIKK